MTFEKEIGKKFEELLNRYKLSNDRFKSLDSYDIATLACIAVDAYLQSGNYRMVGTNFMENVISEFDEEFQYDDLKRKNYRPIYSLPERELESIRDFICEKFREHKAVITNELKNKMINGNRDVFNLTLNEVVKIIEKV